MINPALNLLGGKWSKYTLLSDRPLCERYLGVSFYEAPTKEALYRPEIRNLFNGHGMPSLVQPYYDKAKGLDPLLQMMYLDVKSWLPDDLLVKADKMTMANSLELNRRLLADLSQADWDSVAAFVHGRITDAVIEDVEAWQSRPLEAFYPILYKLGRIGFREH